MPDHSSTTIHVLNGPNLNLLGTREPEVYGRSTLADVETACQVACQRHGLSLVFGQTNHEGELVTLLQQARGSLGVVLNAAAYTHTSIAIADAIKAAGLNVVEVHLSNVFAREAFRHHSFISPVAHGVICGLGIEGYRLAIDALASSRAN
ncbi:type II 3-dehydroquinate dehydratase [Ancylobacter sp. 6x-1]|uniref:3-dehydroquinate dehydratase n=1 Tax=Ancylobacter crimeensis TaxID=2579147 RepID=A0ABT0D6A6_9HYPH|nr:type II 3-dehydroquinate dehydratase [Ancylobacter crimeensis]MCK0195469.1 type II 3-dehydroquinate dehydratase [Ancylobacter crimeensis]